MIVPLAVGTIKATSSAPADKPDAESLKVAAMSPTANPFHARVMEKTYPSTVLS